MLFYFYKCACGTPLKTDPYAELHTLCCAFAFCPSVSSIFAQTRDSKINLHYNHQSVISLIFSQSAHDVTVYPLPSNVVAHYN